MGLGLGTDGNAADAATNPRPTTLDGFDLGVADAAANPCPTTLDAVHTTEIDVLHVNVACVERTVIANAEHRRTWSELNDCVGAGGDPDYNWDAHYSITQTDKQRQHKRCNKTTNAIHRSKTVLTFSRI